MPASENVKGHRLIMGFHFSNKTVTVAIYIGSHFPYC
jgi:hypothetical protein